MNQTKKLTQGAMLLAIIGALMMIDRQFSYFLSTYILLVIPVVIVIYSVMYTNKDGGILCVGLLVFTVLFGELNTYLYMPLSIIVGMGLSIGINRGMDKNKATIIAILLYVVGEITIVTLIQPIFGINISSYIAEYKEMADTMLASIGSVSDEMKAAVNYDSMIPVVFCFGIIVTGVLEGYLTAILTTLLLKRLKIKDIGANRVIDKVLNPIVAYVCMGLVICTYLDRYLIQNEAYSVLGYALMCLSISAAFILAFYGYYYVISYYKYQFGKAIVFIVLLAIFLLTMYAFIILIIVGFLYGAGPLRKKLVDRREQGLTNVN